MVDVEGGSIDITVQFQLISRKAMGVVRAKQTAKEVNGALAVASKIPVGMVSQVDRRGFVCSCGVLQLHDTARNGGQSEYMGAK